MSVRVGCVILAAGAGKRFDGPHNKLVSKFRHQPLVQYAVDAAASSRAMDCTVVSGDNTAEILAYVDLRRCSIVQNSAWREGIAASIRCGLACHADDDACIFLVGDQPYVCAADVDHLIQAFTRERDAIVALQASKIWGTPILFGRSDFPALRRLHGDRGAKRYAQAQKTRLRLIPAIDARALRDVDSPADQ